MESLRLPGSQSFPKEALVQTPMGVGRAKEPNFKMQFPVTFESKTIAAK